MQKYNGQLIRQFSSPVSGNAASGITVTVRRQSDSGLATLYVDNNIAGATLSNPITSSSTGHFAFYAPNDVYTLTFSDSTPVQVIQLQDVAELQAQFDAAVLNAGYIPSGTFSAGATLTQANQVLSDGSSYWRWDGSFPKVVTAGSEPTPVGVGQWFLISDYALRNELADDDSTVLVGGVEAGEIAKRSKAGFRTIEEFGGGVGVADNTAAWQSLLASGAKWAHFGGVGGYKFLGASTHNSDIMITMSTGSFIDCTDAGFIGAYWTKFSGSRSTLPDLSASVSKGAYQVTFSSSHGLQQGDVFFIFNPTPSSWSTFRPVYFSGEMCEVAAVSGTTVRLVSPLYSSYTAAAVDVYKLNPIRVLLGDIDIRGDKSTSLIDIEFGRYCYAKAIKGKHKNNSVLQFIRSYNCAFENVDIFNAGTGTGDDYGVVITNSQIIKGFGGKAHARRHAITTGGDGEICAVPCRDLLFDGITISNDPNSDVFAADFHGNTEGAKYSNCTIYGGATWQGKDNGYENCAIYGMLNGVCIYSSEVVGGTLYARNCRLISYADPSDVSRGVVDIGGNNSAIDSRTVEDVTLDLSGSSINGIDFSTITSMMLMRNRGTTNKINIKIDDIDLKVNNLGQVLFTALDSGTADSDYIIVNNISSTISTKPLCNHNGNHYLDFPHKLQEQSGRQTITTDTGVNQVAGSIQSLKWQYPRIPDASVHPINAGYIGTKIPQGYLDIGALTTTSIRPWIATPDATNFAASQGVVVSWRVSIDEV